MNNHLLHCSTCWVINCNPINWPVTVYKHCLLFALWILHYARSKRQLFVVKSGGNVYSVKWAIDRVQSQSTKKRYRYNHQLISREGVKRQWDTCSHKRHVQSNAFECHLLLTLKFPSTWYHRSRLIICIRGNRAHQRSMHFLWSSHSTVCMSLLLLSYKIWTNANLTNQSIQLQLINAVHSDNWFDNLFINCES